MNDAPATRRTLSLPFSAAMSSAGVTDGQMLLFPIPIIPNPSHALSIAAAPPVATLTATLALPTHPPITSNPRSQPGLKLLSFDGGGIRGLSSLLILKDLMTKVQAVHKREQPLEPWAYFDMIAGTSTGGLIAIMLGRLRMSIDQAIQAYDKLSEKVFRETKPFWKGSRFKASRLEAVLQEIISEHLDEAEPKMLDSRPNACKVFVCAMSPDNMAALIPVHLRTYRVAVGSSPNCAIWQAARATSAAPTYFNRITVQDENGLKYDYIDGGMGNNNPTNRILDEAKHVFPGRRIASLISIGTGHPDTIALAGFSIKKDILPSPKNTSHTKLPREAINMMKKIATDCEKVAGTMTRKFANNPGVYFRLNVASGMQNIGLGDWERLQQVTGHTDAYLRQPTTIDHLNKAADSLANLANLPGVNVNV